MKKLTTSLMSNFDARIAGLITAHQNPETIALSPKERVSALAHTRDLSPADLHDLETIFLASANFDTQRDITRIFLGMRERLLDAEGFNYETPRRDIQDALVRMCAKPNIPHFLKKELEYTLTPPLHHFSTEDKIRLLKKDWDDFSMAGVGGWYDTNILPTALDTMPEERIDFLFNAYRGIAPELYLFEEFLALRDRFHSPGMEHYSNLVVEPGTPSYNEDSAEFTADTPLYFLTQVSDSFGALHTVNGKVHSFFPLEPQKSPGAPTQRVLLSQVLQQEGSLKSDQAVDPELEQEYLLMLEPEFRSTIEREMGVALNTLFVRHQLQLLAFLSHKTDSEVTQVYDFINSAPADQKANRLKSFLSLEQGGSTMGDKILNIGQHLPPRDADALFTAYAHITDTAPGTAQRMRILFQGAFYGDFLMKKTGVNTAQIEQSLLLRANTLLDSADETLIRGEPLDVTQLIIQINQEIKNQEHLLQEVSGYIERIRALCAEARATLLALDQIHNQSRIRALQAEQKLPLFDEDTDEDEFSNVELAAAEFDDGEIEYAMDLAHHMFLTETEIIHLIADYSNPSYYPEISQGERVTALRQLSSAKTLYHHLHRKFENVMYGRESATLSPDLLHSLRESAQAVHPEIVSTGPIYFPVGISADLTSWERVLDREAHFAKPIDLYSYLFWLNNQNQPIDVVICDTIQTTNFLAEHPEITPQDARAKALAIGDHEYDAYQKIIHTFNLQNIRLVRYEDFLESNRDAFTRYRALCENLARRPQFSNAFRSAVQESRTQNPADTDQHLGYALDEIAWILATDGTKVGHINEARYDALALLIKTLDMYGKEQGADIFQVDSPAQLDSALQPTLETLRERINTAKSHATKGSQQDQYLTRLSEHLFGSAERQIAGIPYHRAPTSPETKRGIARILQQNKILESFVPAQSGSLSFGWRQTGNTQGESLRFREPYSTYFYTDSEHIFIDSDQVVAVADGIVSGKILTMSAFKQQEYAESVLRPLLVQYFKTLENAPRSYFSRIGRSREDLLTECRQSETLSDLLGFIQKYIVAPSTS